MDIPKSNRESGIDKGQYTPRSRSASPVQITLDLPPNARERAFREGNFSPALSYNSRNSFHRNSPQIPAPINDILNDEGNVGSLPNTLPEDEAAKVVKLHLVTNEDANSYMSDVASDDDYTTSHHLQGGSITRDIYKWQEDYENQVRIRRSQSFHALSDAENGEGVSNLLTPGGFRRNFLVQKAIQEGREPPNLLTNNFIDFLALYGHFAGDYYPSDDEYDDEGDEEESGRGLGTSDADETTPLNRTTERVKPPPPTQGTASPRKAFFLLIKSFVGTGVLFLPKSFYNGGMLFSTICLIIVAYLSLYCMLLLIESHNIVGGSFGDIGKKLYGRYARYSVLCSIVLSQLGFCCAYTVFVGKNLKELVASVTNCKFNPPLGWFIFIQLVVYIPMAMVRKIKYFSLAALIADVFILAGLGYLYYYDISKLTRLGMAHIELFNPESFALMIGTAIFTFEGIGLVLPIAESMKEPKKFPRVLSITVFLSVSIFLSVAILCYATFGAEVKTVVLLNLPTGEPQVQMVQLLYALAITFSVPLQLFPALRILESGLFPRRSGKQQPIIKWQKNLFRAGLTLFFASVAFFGSNNLDRMVSLIGAFACVPLCFIYPAIFHYKAITSVSESRLRSAPIPVSYGRVQQIKDLILFVLGVVMMSYVTYVTIQNWSGSPEQGSGICDN